MLFVCPTPIGNLGDITQRVLDTLRQVDLIAAEDTRRTRALLTHFEISKPLMSFYEHNEVRRVPELLDRLEAGEDVALVSDAGMPGISDPGYTIISAALEAGLPVEVLPGPSAIETAVVASGFETDSFMFVGYLPRKKGELRKALDRIASLDHTVVAFEAPHRLRTTLAEAETILGMRRLAVCRELTKKHQQIARGTASELIEELPAKVKGEIVLVFDSHEEARLTPLDKEELDYAIRELLTEGLSSKRIAELVSFFTGAPRKQVYEMTLELKEGKGED